MADTDRSISSATCRIAADAGGDGALGHQGLDADEDLVCHGLGHPCPLPLPAPAREARLTPHHHPRQAATVPTAGRGGRSGGGPAGRPT